MAHGKEKHMATAAQHQPKLRGDAGHAGTVVATYDSYVDAERAVDRLSDAKFPVENTEIVGRDLRLVEQVTGRMTLGRATLMGLGAGAWIGLLIGLLIGIFTTTTSAWAAVVLWGVLIGAVWGAIFGFVAQWATHGRREFSSESQIVAAHYDVTAQQAYVSRAHDLLA
jgi:Heat induced stress protein YflT domain